MLNRCKSISPKNIKSQQSAERNANQLKKFKKKVTEQSEPQNAQRFQPQPTAQRSKILPENPIILGQAAPEQHENKELLTSQRKTQSLLQKPQQNISSNSRPDVSALQGSVQKGSPSPSIMVALTGNQDLSSQPVAAKQKGRPSDTKSKITKPPANFNKKLTLKDNDESDIPSNKDHSISHHSQNRAQARQVFPQPKAQPDAGKSKERKNSLLRNAGNKIILQQTQTPTPHNATSTKGQTQSKRLNTKKSGKDKDKVDSLFYFSHPAQQPIESPQVIDDEYVEQLNQGVGKQGMIPDGHLVHAAQFQGEQGEQGAQEDILDSFKKGGQRQMQAGNIGLGQQQKFAEARNQQPQPSLANRVVIPKNTDQLISLPDSDEDQQELGADIKPSGRNQMPAPQQLIYDPDTDQDITDAYNVQEKPNQPKQYNPQLRDPNKQSRLTINDNKSSMVEDSASEYNRRQAMKGRGQAAAQPPLNLHEPLIRPNSSQMESQRQQAAGQPSQSKAQLLNSKLAQPINRNTISDEHPIPS